MNLGFSEMLFIFLLALIIFGPKKLPEIGRQIGKFMAEFKRASNQFKYQLEDEMRQLEISEALKKEKDSLSQVIQTVNDPGKAVINAIMPPEGSVAAGSIASSTSDNGIAPEVASAPAASAESAPAAEYPHLYPPAETPATSTADAHPASSDPGKGANA